MVFPPNESESNKSFVDRSNRMGISDFRFFHAHTPPEGVGEQSLAKTEIGRLSGERAFLMGYGHEIALPISEKKTENPVYTPFFAKSVLNWVIIAGRPVPKVCIKVYTCIKSVYVYASFVRIYTLCTCFMHPCPIYPNAN